MWIDLGKTPAWVLIFVLCLIIDVERVEPYQRRKCESIRLSRSRAMSSGKNSAMENSSNLVSVDFEVFGKVQGVFFRKYTKAKGSMLNLRGWCENTERGTVVGQLEGPRDKVAEMKNWLKTEGSPKSRISHCVFSNEQKIDKYTFNDFNIRK